MWESSGILARRTKAVLRYEWYILELLMSCWAEVEEEAVFVERWWLLLGLWSVGFEECFCTWNRGVVWCGNGSCVYRHPTSILSVSPFYQLSTNTNIGD